MKLLCLLSFLISFSILANRPDPVKTPSKICQANTAEFTEYRYPEHIAYCKRNVSDSTRSKVFNSYGIPQSEWKNYELDHLVPLSSGGSNDATNLWPEPRNQSDVTDKLEYDMYLKLRDGSIMQKDAIDLILKAKNQWD